MHIVVDVVAAAVSSKVGILPRASSQLALGSGHATDQYTGTHTAPQLAHTHTHTQRASGREADAAQTNTRFGQQSSGELLHSGRLCVAEQVRNALPGHALPFTVRHTSDDNDGALDA